MFHYKLIVNDRNKVGERMGISYDLCTLAMGQGAGVSGHPCVFSNFCVAPANFTPHPLGPLPVLNSMASWPKGSIFSLVSPVQPLDRITYRYSYTKALTIRLTCIYTCNICRIKKNKKYTKDTADRHGRLI